MRPSLLRRIHQAIGDEVLHKQQIVDELLTPGTDRAFLEMSVGWCLSKHSTGKGHRVFLRVSHGWYRNRTKGDPIKVMMAQRSIPGKLPQLLYDAMGADTVDVAEVVSRVRALDKVPRARCTEHRVRAVIFNHCGRGFHCFERVTPGNYRRISGRRPRIDPTGHHCQPKDL